MEQNPNRKTILILEDDANDAILIRRAFTNIFCSAFICRNTSEARAYLLGAGMYSDRDKFPFPEIFVTDIRLGNESGVDFLAWLRGNDGVFDLPVIVLSGGATPEEARIAKQLGAARILQKPSDPIALRDLLVTLSREFCGAITHHWTHPKTEREVSEDWKNEQTEAFRDVELKAVHT